MAGAEIDDVFDRSLELPLRGPCRHVRAGDGTVTSLSGRDAHGIGASWRRWSRRRQSGPQPCHSAIVSTRADTKLCVAQGMEIGDEALGWDGCRCRAVRRPGSTRPLFMTAMRSDMVNAPFLIVGDEDEGDARLCLQALQFDLHLLAQFQVECRQWLSSRSTRGCGARARASATRAAGRRDLRGFAAGPVPPCAPASASAATVSADSDLDLPSMRRRGDVFGDRSCAGTARSLWKTVLTGRRLGGSRQCRIRRAGWRPRSVLRSPAIIAQERGLAAAGGGRAA